MDGLFWSVLLLGLGLGCLVAEVFLPSWGVLGLLSVICLVGSGYLAATISATIGLRWLAVELVSVPIAWAGASYGLPRTRIGRRAYLAPPTAAELGRDDGRSPLLGRVGDPCHALTPLRPSGTVEVGGRRVEALAESGLIDAGSRVKVVAIRSGRLIVRAD